MSYPTCALFVKLLPQPSKDEAAHVFARQLVVAGFGAGLNGTRQLSHSPFVSCNIVGSGLVSVTNLAERASGLAWK